MSQVSKTVANNFSDYTLFLSSEKTHFTGFIVLEKGIATEDDLITQYGCASLHSEVCFRRREKYTFKVFLLCFGNGPCFRFDSWGNRHMNPHQDGISLAHRSVPTPHFHKFREDGIEVAFQTPEMQQAANVLQIRADPQVGMDYFCIEFKIRTANDSGIQITVANDDLTLDNNDPLADVSFN